MNTKKHTGINISAEAAESLTAFAEEMFQTGFEDGVKHGFHNVYPDPDMSDDLCDLLRECEADDEFTAFTREYYENGYNAGYVRGVCNRIDMRNVMV